MVLDAKRIGARALRLIVGLVLLGCPRAGSAAGTWSVISLPQKCGKVLSPRAVAVDAASNFYVADRGDDSQIQERDVKGNWSVIATLGTAPGQTLDPSAIAADAAGTIYVTDYGDDGKGNSGDRIQKRDARGDWSVIAMEGYDIGQVCRPRGLAVDATGHLYVAEYGNDRIQKRDAQGNWSLIAAQGSAPGPELGRVLNPTALAADASGNLYIAEPRWCYEYGCISFDRIQKHNAQA